MITDKQAKPGDMTKFMVSCDGKDITNAVTDVHVFEDIFSPCWTSNIIVVDTSNLLMTLPITPGSEIKVHVATQLGTPLDNEKEFEFRVAAIVDKELVNTGSYSYVLSCVDKRMLSQSTKRVSKSYRDRKISDVVKNIAQEFLDGAAVDVHDTDANASLIVPNLSPLTAIPWVTKAATKSKAADFFFFQTDTDRFAFKSFEDMFANDDESLNMTLTNKHTNLADESGNPVVDYSLNIGTYHFEHYDSISNLSSGYFKNTVVSYDLTSKEWTKKVFEFGDDCKADKQLKGWKDQIAQGAENASISFKPMSTGAFGKGLKGIQDTAKDWIGSRKSSVQKADQERLIAQIPGSVGCWKWIGKNLQVDLPSQEETSNERNDKYRSGRYVVVALAHMFSKSYYAVNLEMVKKRLEEELE